MRERIRTNARYTHGKSEGQHVYATAESIVSNPRHAIGFAIMGDSCRDFIIIYKIIIVVVVVLSSMRYSSTSIGQLHRLVSFGDDVAADGFFRKEVIGAGRCCA